jgi:protein-S-isoprenylcysteine O-methyltransferase Ste14
MKKIAGLVIYLFLGYAIPLAGNPELLLNNKILFLMLCCGVIVFTQPAMDASEAKEKSATDRQTFWLILGLSLTGMVAPLIDWAYFQADQSLISPITFIGGFLIIFGIFIRVWAIRILGKFFTATVQIHEDHQLIQQGPYKLIRHPSYLGAFMAFIGSALFLNSPIGALIAAIAMLTAYYYRIKTEESVLLKAFGSQYVRYQKNTKKLIPLVW